MLIRDTTPKSPEEWYENSVMTNPGMGRTALDKMAQGFAGGFVALSHISPSFEKTDFAHSMQNIYDAVQEEQRIPNKPFIQEGTDFIANMIGYTLNPITLAAGVAGGLVAGIAARGVAPLVPEAVSVLARKPLSLFNNKTLGVLSEETVKNFGRFSGAMVPQAVVNNYDRDIHSINWLGVARESGEMGALGLAISTIPFAWGVIRGKVNNRFGKKASEPVVTSELDKALEDKVITPEQHKWMTDYMTKDLTDPAVKEALEKEASEMLAKEGHSVNTATHEVPFDIFDSKTIDNLKSSLADQLTTNVPEDMRSSLTDFIAHNGLDKLRSNHKMLDGLKGYTDFINERISKKSERLEKANKILDEHLLKSIKNDMDFSQKEIFKHIAKSNFDLSHIKSLPVTIPKAIETRLNQLDKIQILTKKNHEYQKQVSSTRNKGKKIRIAKYSKLIEKNNEKIKAINDNLEKILTPKEELVQLKESLLSEHGLPKNYRLSKDYQRLLDLSNVWHNAKTLLDRVHLEEEYNKQEAFAHIVDSMTKIMESPVERLSKPRNVLDYVNERLSEKIYKKSPVENIEEKVKFATETPADIDAVINEYRQEVKSSKAEDLKKDFAKADKRLSEFKKSEGIFKSFIACVMGA